MTFAETLRKLRRKSKLSIYALSRFSGLDQGYIRRLENGEKTNPSRSTVILLALSLVHGCDNITLLDIQELLLSAEYAPLRKRDRTPIE